MRTAAIALAVALAVVCSAEASRWCWKVDPTTGGTLCLPLLAADCPSGWQGPVDECDGSPPPTPTPTPTPSPTPPPTPTPAVILPVPNVGSEAAAGSYDVLGGEINGYPEILGNYGPQNYIQAPTAYLLDDGTAVVLGNTGHCCYSAQQAWEGVFALVWPPGGGSPYWMPVYGTNNYGRTWRGEHEMGFVTAGYMEGRWVIVGIGTLASSWGLSNRAQLWVLEMQDLTSGVITSPWRLLQCSSGGCDPFPHPTTGQCIGTGFGASLLRFRSRWYLYASDDCSGSWRGFVRYEIVNPADLTLGPRERIYFDGAVGGVGEFALGRDGRVYAMSDTAARDALDEWASADGIFFTRTGLRWAIGDRPGALWDGSWLKTPSGSIVEPRVWFASVSPVDDLWQFAPANPWSILWWADSAAGLPYGWWVDPDPNATRLERRTSVIRRRLPAAEGRMVQ